MLFNTAKNQLPPLSAAELSSIQVQYELLHLKAKDALTEKKKINCNEMDFYATLVKDIASFLRLKQGPMEQALE